MPRTIILETNDGEFEVDVADNVSEEELTQWLAENRNRLDKGGIANPLAAIGESAITSTSQTIAGLGRLLPGFVGEAFTTAGEGFEEMMVPGFLETNPLRQQELPTKVGAGLGSIAPVAFGGGLGGAALKAVGKRVTAKAAMKTVGPKAVRLAQQTPSITASMSGGLLAGESEARQAEAAGASELEVMFTFLANAGVTATSEFFLGAPVAAIKKMVGNENAVNLLRANLFKTVKDKGVFRLGRAGVAGFAGEAAQESTQQVAANLIAGQLYDPNRPALEGIGEAALVGGLVGGVVGTAGGVMAVSLDELDRVIKDTVKDLEEADNIPDPEERQDFVETRIDEIADISDLDPPTEEEAVTQPEERAEVPAEEAEDTPQSEQIAVKGPVGDRPAMTFEQYQQLERDSFNEQRIRGYTFAPSKPNRQPPRTPLLLAAPPVQDAPPEGATEEEVQAFEEQKAAPRIIPATKEVVNVAQKAAESELDSGPNMLASIINIDGTLNREQLGGLFGDLNGQGKLRVLRKIFRENEELANVELTSKSVDGYIDALEGYLESKAKPVAKKKEPTAEPAAEPTAEEPVSQPTESALDAFAARLQERFEAIYTKSGLLLASQRRVARRFEKTYKNIPLAVRWGRTEKGDPLTIIISNPESFLEAQEAGMDLDAMFYEEVLHDVVMRILGDAEPTFMKELGQELDSVPGTKAELKRLRPDIDPKRNDQLSREYVRMIMQAEGFKVTEGYHDLPRPTKGTAIYDKLKSLADRLGRNNNELLAGKINIFIGRTEFRDIVFGYFGAKELNDIRDFIVYAITNPKEDHIDDAVLTAINQRTNNPGFQEKITEMIQKLEAIQKELRAGDVLTNEQREELNAKVEEAKAPVLKDLKQTAKQRVLDLRDKEAKEAAKGMGEVREADVVSDKSLIELESERQAVEDYKETSAVQRIASKSQDSEAMTSIIARIFNNLGQFAINGLGLAPDTPLAEALQEYAEDSSIQIWETEAFSEYSPSTWLSVANRIYDNEVERAEQWVKDNPEHVEKIANAFAASAEVEVDSSDLLVSYKDALREVLELSEAAARGVSRQAEYDLNVYPDFVREIAKGDPSRYMYDKMTLPSLIRSLQSKVKGEGIPSHQLWHHARSMELSGNIERLTAAEEAALVMISFNGNMDKATEMRLAGDAQAAKSYDRRIADLLTSKAFQSVAAGQGLKAFDYAKMLTAEHWVAQAELLTEKKNNVNKNAIKNEWRRHIKGLAEAAANAASEIDVTNDKPAKGKKQVKIPEGADQKVRKRNKATKQSLDWLNKHKSKGINRLLVKLINGSVKVDSSPVEKLFFDNVIKSLGDAIAEQRGPKPQPISTESKTQQLRNLLSEVRAMGDPSGIQGIINEVRNKLEAKAFDENDMSVTEAELVYLDEILGNVADKPFSSKLGKAVINEALAQLGQNLSTIARQSFTGESADWDKLRKDVRELLEKEIPSHIDALMDDLDRMIDTAIINADKPRPATSKEFKDQIASSIISRVRSAKKDSPARQIIARFVKLVDDYDEVKGRPTIETIHKAIQNASRYQSAIRDAREWINEKYKYNQDVLAEANAMFDDLSPLPIRDSDLRATIRSEVDINTLVKQHYNQQGAVSSSLAERLIADAGLAPSDAAELEARIAKEIGKMVAERKKLSLDAFVRSFEKSKRGKKKKGSKSSVGRLIEMVNMGILDDNKAWDLFRQDIDMPELSLKDKQWLTKQAERLSKIENLGEQTVEAQKVAAQLNAKIGYSLTDIFKAAWYASALSGVSTTPVAALLGNFTGTAVLMTALVGQRLLNGDLAGVGRIFTIASDGFMGGAKEFMGAVKEGRLMDDSMRAGPDTFEAMYRYGDLSKGQKAMALTGAIPGRLLTAVDAGLQYGLERSLLDAISYDAAKDLLGDTDPSPQRIAEKAAEISDKIGLTGKDGILQQIEETASKKFKEGSEGYKEFVAAELDERLREISPAGRFDDRGLIKEQLTYRNKPTGLVGEIVGNLDNVLRQLENSPDRSKRVMGTVARLKFMPFSRTMANIINDTLAYNPLNGFFKFRESVPRDPEMKDWIGSYNKSLTLQREIGITKAAIGTVGLGLGAMGLILNGLFEDDEDDPFFAVLGSGPDDPKAAEFLRNSGRSQNAVRFGALALKYSEFPAAAGLFALLGTVNDYIKFTRDTEEEMVTRLSLFGQLAKQQYLSMGSEMPWAGIVRDLSMVSSGRKTFSDLVAETAVVAVPRINALNQLYDFYAATFGRPAVDRSSPKGIPSDMKELERFVEQLAISRATPIARMFGWGDPKYDAFGDPLDASAPPSRFIALDKDTNEITKTLIDNGLYIPFSKALRIQDSETRKLRAMSMDELLLFRVERGRRLKQLLKANLSRLSKMDQALAQELVTRLARKADVFGKRRVQTLDP